MKRATKINRNDPIFFHTIIVQVCTDRTKNILNTNCIALHVAPNMANNTQNHGYMKNERLVLELDIKKYMYGHMTLTPRY
jgi:hypothetical protein